MTLAGTRPPTVDEWEKYELHHRARLATKPGLTGMWQVSGRSKSDFGEYECNNNGTALTLDFEKNTTINEIRIVIKEYEGIAGISEIELLPQEAYSNTFPFESYCSKTYKRSSKRWMTNIERIILSIRFLFTFKVGYEIRKWKEKYVK